ncbi:factor V activator-like [Battus philenor]|uniref:factor V activator-like n=1 Tax=Battus philenor TaxID=42288 RepID=UPI0035D0156A
MIRFCFLHTCLVIGFLAHWSVSQGLDNINKLFDGKYRDQEKCSGISGDLGDGGCHECYPCDDWRIKNYRSEVKELKFKLPSCKSTTVCCISQRILSVKEGGSCGQRINDGNKYVNGKTQSRKTVRSVLVGEYPWMAWIYRLSSSKILCAGTVIDDNAEVVLTSASCVDGIAAADLAVSFTRQRNEKVRVASILLNNHYTSGVPKVNDIAMIKLDKHEESPPKWVTPICLPLTPVMHATSCIATSDSDNYLNTVVPLTKICVERNVMPELGQMCSVSPIGDYEPEHGSALICQDELHTGGIQYYVYGIALGTTSAVTTYTDIYKYLDWINDNMYNL